MSIAERFARPSAPIQKRSPGRASRLIVAGYALAGYLLFLAVLGYSVGFFVSIGVPKSIDQGTRSPWPIAVGVDIALLALFAGQHTVMARPWFKRRLTRLVPEPAERSTYVVCASLVLVLLYWQWRPIGGPVWHTSGIAADVLLGVNAIGWLVAIGSTFLINHYDLVGLRQAYLHARGVSYGPPPFVERSLYRYVRHPLMTGFLIIFWAAPAMTAGHLFFAAAATGYILIGIRFEEHDLKSQLGQPYQAYLARVPALGPMPRRRPHRPAQN